MWNPFATATAAVAAIFRMEQDMGKIADELAGLPEQIDKVIAEQLANQNKLDDADRAMIKAVKDGVQKADDLNPDAPTEPPVQ